MQNCAFVGYRGKQALILIGALPQVLQVASNVHCAHEFCRIFQIVQVFYANPSHADHVKNHGEVVGKFHSASPLF